MTAIQTGVPQVSDRSSVDDAERTADLFVGVLAKALADRVLGEAFEGQITMSQLQALRYLQRNEQRLMSDLAEGLTISYPAATKTVERLVKKGLVMREGDPTDRRVVRVKLTGKGMELVQQVNNELGRRLTAVLARMQEGDRDALLRGMAAFVEAALADVDDVQVVASICLHCGTAHSDSCPVGGVLLRAQTLTASCPP